MNKNKFIFLSYELSKSTPCYRGLYKLGLKKINSIDRQDSSNVTEVSLSSHLGTHIDFPRHFLQFGKSGDRYTAGHFVFNEAKAIEVPKNMGLIYQQDLAIGGLDKSLEILLIKTGMGNLRSASAYKQNYPGIHHECAGFLERVFPNLRAIGLDLISLSSVQNREEGRLAHREFLRRGIWIIEDMNLSKISKKSQFKQITVAPLLFKNCDGAPCAVLAELND